MADLNPQGTPSIAADNHHEGPDINMRAVLVPVGTLGALIVLIFLTAWGMLSLFGSHPASEETPLSPLASLPRKAPSPTLQAPPPQDLPAYRAREDRELNSYAWIARSSGRVQIPIDRAKELFIKENSPISQDMKPSAPDAPAPISTGGTGK